MWLVSIIFGLNIDAAIVQMKSLINFDNNIHFVIDSIFHERH